MRKRQNISIKVRKLRYFCIQTATTEFKGMFRAASRIILFITLLLLLPLRQKLKLSTIFGTFLIQNLNKKI